MSINTWWLEVDAEVDSSDTYDVHVCLFRPAMFRCIAILLCMAAGMLPCDHDPGSKAVSPLPRACDNSTWLHL